MVSHSLLSSGDIADLAAHDLKSRHWSHFYTSHPERRYESTAKEGCSISNHGHEKSRVSDKQVLTAAADRSNKAIQHSRYGEQNNVF